jgi:hypothetical protein
MHPLLEAVRLTKVERCVDVIPALTLAVLLITVLAMVWWLVRR